MTTIVALIGLCMGITWFLRIQDDSPEVSTVCVCGPKGWRRNQTVKQLGRAGYIVTVSGAGDGENVWKGKVKISDTLFVVNPNQKISPEMKDKISYAESEGLRIWYLEP